MNRVVVVLLSAAVLAATASLCAAIAVLRFSIRIGTLGDPEQDARETALGLGDWAAVEGSAADEAG